MTFGKIQFSFSNGTRANFARGTKTLVQPVLPTIVFFSSATFVQGNADNSLTLFCPFPNSIGVAKPRSRITNIKAKKKVDEQNK